MNVIMMIQYLPSTISLSSFVQLNFFSRLPVFALLRL